MATKIDGINVHTDANHVSRVTALGCEWVRIDIQWWVIEKNRGSYSWGYVDSLVNAYTKAGCKIYATLAGTPAWAGATIADVPSNQTFWTSFCAACAKRYGGRISVYSLWNEPNLGNRFWRGGIKDFYQKILVPGALAIKGVNHNLAVAGPDLATTGKSKWTKWLTEMKHHVRYIDIVSIHSYHNTADTVKRCFTIGKIPFIGWIVPKWRPYNWYLKKLGKPVFLTETGLAATFGKSKEEKAQKNFVEEIQDSKKDMDVDTVIFYTCTDAPSSMEEPWGFYDYQGNAKLVAR